MHPGQLSVSVPTVRRLVAAQFPQWRQLPVTAVDSAGTVNAVFRIGDALSARFPIQDGDPQRVLRSQVRVGALEQVELFFEFRRLHLLQVFFQALQPLFDLAQIADHEVKLDILNIAQRIDGSDVRDCGIVKGPQDVGERVHAT